MSGQGVDLNAVADAVVDFYKANLPGLGQCKVYAGEFDGERRVAISPPSLFVACLGGVPEDVGTEQVELICRFAAYVVAEHAGDRASRQRNVLTLTEAVCLLTKNNQWGMKQVSPATLTRVENASTGQIQGRALALWVVTWEQRLRLGVSVWQPDGFQPTEIYAGYKGQLKEDYERLEFPDTLEDED